MTSIKVNAKRNYKLLLISSFNFIYIITCVTFSSREMTISNSNRGTSALPHCHGSANFLIEHSYPIYWKNCQVQTVILDILLF